MKTIYTILLAFLGIVLVVGSDLFLQKISTRYWLGRVMSNKIIRMTVSYIIGIVIFLIGVRIIYTLV